jgi:hypothetical protein
MRFVEKLYTDYIVDCGFMCPQSDKMCDQNAESADGQLHIKFAVEKRNYRG